MDYDTNTKQPDGVTTILKDGINAIPFFTLIVAFVFYIITDSTLFNAHILARMSNNGALVNDAGDKTTAGVLVAAIIFAFMLAIMEGAHNAKII